MKEDKPDEAEIVFVRGELTEAIAVKENAAIPTPQDNWITKRIAQAVDKFPVADEIASEIKNQLNETMCERALRPVELSVLAQKLLAIKKAPSAKENK